MKTLYLADTYVVVSKAHLNNENRKVLTALYQPIIGGCALSLYMSFWFELEEAHHVVTEHTHHQIASLTQMNVGDIREARERLEAMGLMKTFVHKSKQGRTYVYELFNPLSANQFFAHPLLKASLFSALGRNQYDYMRSIFKVSSFSLTGYDELTKSFNDIYKMVSVDDEFYDEYDTFLDQVTKEVSVTDDSFDFELLEANLIKQLVDPKILTPSLRKNILTLSVIYNLSEDDVSRLLMRSFDVNGVINHKMLSKVVRQFYQYNEDGAVPKLVTNHQVNSKIANGQEEIVTFFKSITPFDLLKRLQDGAEPFFSDLKLIEDLLTKRKMKPEVVNVLIDYVIRTTGGKFTQSFVEKVAGTWIRNKINTCEKALAFVRNELETQKKSSKKSNNRNEQIPKTFEDDKKANKASEERQKELQEYLKSFS